MAKIKKTLNPEIAEIKRKGVSDVDKEAWKKKVSDTLEDFKNAVSPEGEEEEDYYDLDDSDLKEGDTVSIETKVSPQKSEALNKLSLIVGKLKKEPAIQSAKTKRDNDLEEQAQRHGSGYSEENIIPMDLRNESPHSPEEVAQTVQDTQNNSAYPRDFNFLRDYYHKLGLKLVKGNVYELEFEEEVNPLLSMLKGKTTVRVKYDQNSEGGVYTVAYSLNKENIIKTFEFETRGKKKKYMLEKEVFNYIMDALGVISDFVSSLIVSRKVIRLNEMNDRGELNGRLIENLEDSVYHHPDAPGLSNSLLGLVEKSPLDLDTKYVTALIEKEEERYFLIGRAFHDFILRPELFETYNYVIPKKNEDQFWGIAQKIYDLEAIGKNKVTQKEFELFKLAQKHVNEHPTSRAILSEGKSEVSAYSNIGFSANNGKDYKVLSRVRFDKLIENPSEELKEILYYELGLPKEQDYFIIADLKFLKENTDHNNVAGNAFANYAYHNAGAYYVDVGQQVMQKAGYFIFVTVAKTGVCDVICYKLTDEDLDVGRENYERNIMKYVDEYTNAFYPLIKTCEELIGEARVEMGSDYTILKEMTSSLFYKYDPRVTVNWKEFLTKEIEKIEPLRLILDKYPAVKREVLRKIGWRGRYSGIKTLPLPYRIHSEYEKVRKDN